MSIHDENLTKLATVSQKKIFPAGHKIIQQGQISECFYIIQKGVVSVRAYPNEAEEIKKQELIIQQNLEKTKQKKSLHRYLNPMKMEKTYQNKILENEALLEGFREAERALVHKSACQLEGHVGDNEDVRQQRRHG